MRCDTAKRQRVGGVGRPSEGSCETLSNKPAQSHRRAPDRLVALPDGGPVALTRKLGHDRIAAGRCWIAAGSKRAV